MVNRFVFRPDFGDDIRLLHSHANVHSLLMEPKLHSAPRGFYSFLRAILNEFPIKIDHIKKDYVGFQVSDPLIYIQRIRDLQRQWCDAPESHILSLKQSDIESRKLIRASKSTEHSLINDFLESSHDVLQLFPFVIGFEYNLRTKPGYGDFKLASEEFPGFVVVVEAKITSKYFEDRRSKVLQQVTYYSKITRQENPDLIILPATLTDVSGFQWYGGSHFVFSGLVENHNTKRKETTESLQTSDIRLTGKEEEEAGTELSEPRTSDGLFPFLTSFQWQGWRWKSAKK